MIKDGTDDIQICWRCNTHHGEVVMTFVCDKCGAEYCPLCKPDWDDVCDCGEPAEGRLSQ